MPEQTATKVPAIRWNLVPENRCGRGNSFLRAASTEKGKGAMGRLLAMVVCFDYRRSLANGYQPDGSEGWWGLIDPEHISATAAATRAAFSR